MCMYSTDVTKVLQLTIPFKFDQNSYQTDTYNYNWLGMCMIGSNFVIYTYAVYLFILAEPEVN